MMFSMRLGCGRFAESTGMVYVTLSVEKCNIKSRADARNIALEMTKERGFPSWQPTTIQKPKDAQGLCLVIGRTT